MRPLSMAIIAALVMFMTPIVPVKSASNKLENRIYIDLKYGRVTLELFPDLAKNHVARIKKLTKQGFYNGLKFHRVLEGFMAQTGDPTGTGAGGSKLSNLKAEFSNLKKATFKRGTLGAARTQDPDTANSQFFICLEAAPWLNGQYTVFGEVTKGMEFVDMIKKGAPGSGTVDNPDIIVKMQMAADAK